LLKDEETRCLALGFTRPPFTTLTFPPITVHLLLLRFLLQ